MNNSLVTATPHVEHHLGTAVSLHAFEAPEHAIDSFFDEVRSLEARLSRFRSDSEVMRLERGELTLDDASPQVREVLVRCEAIRSTTEGAFDHRPVVGGCQVLDPNAFAKGWIIEQAALHLRIAGVESYVVNAGGDVVAGAPPPGREAWRAGIVHPHDPSTVFATVDLDNAAIATSGRYERGDHIRATGTGRAPCDPLTSVSVVGPELATADALATAVFASAEPRPSWWSTHSPYGIIAVVESGRVFFTDNIRDVVRLGGHSSAFAVAMSEPTLVV